MSELDTSPSPAPGPRAAVFRAWRRGLLVAAATLGLVAVLLVAGRPRRRPDAVVEKSPAVVTVPRTVLRRRPELGSEAVAKLERGDAVTIIADRGIWLEARAGGASGFLQTGEVERKEDREAREERARKILSFSPVYGVVAEDTPVLLAPYPFAPQAGVLARGAGITIHAVDHAYFAYRDRANGVAYVASADVDLVPPDPKSPEIVPDSAGSLKRLNAWDTSPAIPTPYPTAVPFPEAPVDSAESSPPLAPPPPPLAPPPAGSSVEPAVLVEKVDPAYPEAAVRAAVEGSVVLDIGIDEDGRVTDAQVTRGLPFGLSEAAVDAVRQWRYRPARGPGGAIPSRKSVRILFTLRGGE
jgi:TonB family protein